MSQTTNRSYLYSFSATLALILLVTLYRIYFLTLDQFDLFFDEAQYWYWAKHPAFGYYSKPPIIAWVIALTTSFCGEGEFCIRLGAPILHSLTATTLFFIGKKLFDNRVGFWSAITYITLPAVSLSSILISTDVALLLFWALALYAFIRAIDSSNIGWWLLAGVAAGLGMLSKYIMILFLPSALLYLYYSPAHRPLMKSWKLWLAVGITFLVFLPNLVWNAQNGFVSFLHTKDNANLQEGNMFHLGEFFAFLGAQFAVFGPILFGTLLFLLFRFRKTIPDNRYNLLVAFIFPILMVILCVSFLSRAHANWAAPIYIPATVLVVAWLLEHVKLRWIQLSIGLHIVIALIGMHLYTIEAMTPITLSGKKAFAFNKGKEGLTIKDPFKRLKGSKEFGTQVATLLDHHPNTLLLTDERKSIALLTYYVQKANNFTKPLAFAKWNDDRVIQDHYELISDMGNYPGRNALFVTRDSDPFPVFIYFSNVDHVKTLSLPLYDDYTVTYDVYYLTNFEGY